MDSQISATGIRRGSHPVLNLIGAISTLCGWFAAALIVASIFVTCQMVFVRYVLGQSTIWQTEAVIYMMIATTTIGLAYVQRLRGHVNVDLVPAMLPIRARRVLAYVVLILTIAIVATIAWYGLHAWYEAFTRNWKSSTVWGVRLWIPWLALPVGFGLYLLQLLADLAALYLRIDEPFSLEQR
ncbi:TRAP transporter small permease [Aquamicrobium sp. LC103]|uniref:TRAP transporter small permease subunit n=1 Tax=Aquamicrobium sp. LC103 TaxID=1120658 RepID=UPI00063EA6A1|nr:TRAP transporter small permease [Aquamicrobium sp. LC103]TKT74375.1 TRAP transporter small permease [Aquamicrobium sp. LC103]